MPFQSISESGSTLTIIPYSRKYLYVKEIFYFILLYLIADIHLGFISAINPEAQLELLFSFQSLATKYNITFQTMRDNPALIYYILGIFLVIIVSFAIVSVKFSDIFGIIIPPIKSKRHLYPHLVVLSQQGIEVHSKKNGQEIKKFFSWRKEIYSVLVRNPTQYKLNISLILSSIIPEEALPNSKEVMHEVKLDKFFISKRDRKHAATTLRTYFQTYFPDVYNRKPDFLQ